MPVKAEGVLSVDDRLINRRIVCERIKTVDSANYYNFSAGPAIMPRSVLARAREEMLSPGRSVMEISHRSDRFLSILDAAESGIRELLGVPQGYKVLFLQGGASLQFAMVPMNFLVSNRTADYVITGAWGTKALAEAKSCGEAREIFSTAETGFRSIPEEAELSFSPQASYAHYTSNETIDGVEFNYDLDGKAVPVICDASSNILSKPIDIEKYALLYAGAQKNIGPSGVTLVIIRDEMIAAAPTGLSPMLSYRSIAENRSMLNTPNTWGIYLVGLVCEWLRTQGGLASMKSKNERKAAVIYNAIDMSDGFYQGHAERHARSMMNVTFRLGSQDRETHFVSEAEAAGFHGLRGHRSVGGMRASIYNAFPHEGCEALAGFMQDFAQNNG